MAVRDHHRLPLHLRPADDRAVAGSGLHADRLDGLDAYFARYLPQLVLACAVPFAVIPLFGRGQPQAASISKVTQEYRQVTMSTLRVAFLSGFVLELAAALATALVAVEVGLRLLAGHMSYQTPLLVLLLTPEAYLPRTLPE